MGSYWECLRDRAEAILEGIRANCLEDVDLSSVRFYFSQDDGSKLAGALKGNTSVTRLTSTQS